MRIQSFLSRIWGRLGGGRDFYCHKAALVIEVDGDIHDLQQEDDARREKVLHEIGLRVMRFRNNEVLKDLSNVVGEIKELIYQIN
jgi:very-short-patch-repair endonuclease